MLKKYIYINSTRVKRIIKIKQGKQQQQQKKGGKLMENFIYLDGDMLKLMIENVIPFIIYL